MRRIITGKQEKFRVINILFLIPTLGAGGAERQLLNLLSGINRKNFNIHFVILKSGGILEEEIPLDIKVLRVKNYKNIVISIVKIVKYLQREKIEILHSFLPLGNFYSFLIKLFSFRKIILITSHRGLRSSLFSKATLFDKLSMKFSDKIVVNSKTVKKNCTDFLKIKDTKVEVIYNGIIDLYSNKERKNFLKERIDGEGLTVLSVGRFDGLKGHNIIVDAVLILLDRGFKFKTVIAGDGPMRGEMKKKVSDRGYSELFEFPGNVSDIGRFYSSSDIFILGTFSEGLSNVICEAMLCELPVITSDIPSNKEIIDDRKNGILIEPGNIPLFSENLEILLNDKKKRNELGIKGREKVLNLFSVNGMISLLENLYEKIYFKLEEE